jgi:hypothetical protein
MTRKEAIAEAKRRSLADGTPWCAGSEVDHGRVRYVVERGACGVYDKWGRLVRCMTEEEHMAWAREGVE